ncbi:hypothetical protein B0J12DRAFT_582885 [Macrophomina phaseolina]|uniref:Uncharacterized protein n=1 Tax=Macrophomina phaseolina TaxID=35725 RepID=A0ABQ8G003_9PEZI|nr:hypothetical protein B0J12DRAFT_582885 [Macrophomina phaseolina]
MLPQFTFLLLAAAIPQALCSAIPAEDTNTDLGIPQDFIDKVMASFTTDENGQLVSRAELHKRTIAARGLEKRATPTDQRCGGDTWRARYYMTDVGPRDWHDRCRRPNGSIYWVGGICPEFTYCSEEFDNDGDDVIICTPATPPREDNVGSTARGRRQYGYRTIQPRASIGANQHLSSILLQLGISRGSVSGHLRSTDRTFVIAPQNTLTANLHGRQLNLCRSDTNQDDPNAFRNTRSCSPVSDHNFVNGDTIDFTFGLSSFQSAILFYNVTP